MKALVPAMAALLLAGCGGVTRHCVGEFEYQRAQTLSPPEQVEGLTMPESVAALRIPPPPDEPVPYAIEYADPDKPGKTRVDCLDVPPRIRVAAEPPEAPEAPKAPEEVPEEVQEQAPESQETSASPASPTPDAGS